MEEAKLELQPKYRRDTRLQRNLPGHMSWTELSVTSSTANTGAVSNQRCSVNKHDAASQSFQCDYNDRVNNSLNRADEMTSDE